MNEQFVAIQTSNELKLSRSVTGISDDDIGVKALLTESNDSCWETTSCPKMYEKGNKL